MFGYLPLKPGVVIHPKIKFVGIINLRQSLHETKFTWDKVYLRQSLPETKFTLDKVYLRQSLHETKFTWDRVYMRQSLHETKFMFYMKLERMTDFLCCPFQCTHTRLIALTSKNAEICYAIFGFWLIQWSAGLYGSDFGYFHALQFICIVINTCKECSTSSWCGAALHYTFIFQSQQRGVKMLGYNCIDDLLGLYQSEVYCHIKSMMWYPISWFESLMVFPNKQNVDSEERILFSK